MASCNEAYHFIVAAVSFIICMWTPPMTKDAVKFDSDFTASYIGSEMNDSESVVNPWRFTVDLGFTDFYSKFAASSCDSLQLTADSRRDFVMSNFSIFACGSIVQLSTRQEHDLNCSICICLLLSFQIKETVRSKRSFHVSRISLTACLYIHWK